MQYTWDSYHSICSAIKYPLEIPADDYFVTSNGMVCDAIQAAYIVLLIMGYLLFHAYQEPSFCLLPSVYRSVCFDHVSVCASVRLEIHSPENTSMITYVRALTCSYISFYILPLLLLYMMEKCVFSYGSGEINKQTLLWNS